MIRYISSIVGFLRTTLIIWYFVVFPFPIKVQLQLGIYQWGYSFALVERRIHLPVYLYQEWDLKLLAISGFQYPILRVLSFDSSLVFLDTIKPWPSPSSTFKIKRVECLLATRAIRRIQSGLNYIGCRAWHDQPVGPSNHLSIPVRVKVKCCRSYDHFSIQIKYYKSLPMVNRWPRFKRGVLLSTEVQSAYSIATTTKKEINH